MSFQAVTWAIEQRAGNPSAKAVLWSIANYANEHWCAYPKQETVANDSEQSVDSVGKRISDLIDLGLMRRIKLKRFGRRTHDFIVLKPSALFEAGIEEILPLLPSGCDVLEDSPHATAICGSVESEENATPQEESQPSATANSGSAENPTLPQSAVDATALVRQHEPVTEPKNPPQAPPWGGVQDKISEEAKARWLRFKINYPDGMTDPLTAAVEFHKLSEADQEQAIAAETVYVARCRSRREKSMKAHLFLRKRAFEGILAAPAENPSVSGPYDPASEAGRALIALARIAHTHLPRTGDGRIIYTKPITAQLLALAQAPQERTRYTIGSNSFGAWWALIKAHLSNPPNLTEIDAPWPFPPSKDGKIYDTAATGPPPTPTTLCTQEDEREFAKL